MGGQPEDVGHGPALRLSEAGSPSPQVLATQGNPSSRPTDSSASSPRASSRIASRSTCSRPTTRRRRPLRLNQTGTGHRGRSGRSPTAACIVEDWITDAERNDIYFVDPVARTQRAIASTGNVVATGRDWCLALLHWVASGGSGDLTIVDYATGAADAHRRRTSTPSRSTPRPTRTTRSRRGRASPSSCATASPRPTTGSG